MMDWKKYNVFECRHYKIRFAMPAYNFHPKFCPSEFVLALHKVVDNFLQITFFKVINCLPLERAKLLHSSDTFLARDVSSCEYHVILKIKIKMYANE